MQAAVDSFSSRATPLPEAGPATPMQVRCTTATDIDAHTEQLIDWNLRYDQLDCGAFQGGFTDIRWPGMQLFVETTTRRVRQRGHLPADSFGIGTMLKGDGAVCINGKRGGPESMIAVHSAEFDACTPANCTLAGLVVDTALLRNAAKCMPELSQVLQDGAWLAINTTPENAQECFRTLLVSVVESALEHPQTLCDEVVQRHLRDELLLHVVEVVAGAQRSDEIDRADARKRIVDRACDMLLAQPSEPPSLLEVCNRVGASPRKLSSCFQDVLDLSPARYIKTIRLNAVRRELRSVSDAHTSVYDIAARWGFWHFGHFSSDYKGLFSELPSDTLRRARGREKSLQLL